MSFIKIHREIVDSQVWCHQGMLKFWIWLLLKANYKDGFAAIKIGNGIKSVKVNRGQLLFGRDKADSELDIDGSTLYKWLKKFQEWEQIKIESNSHYSLITIANYNDYQDILTATEQPSNSQVTATEQPSNTSKEVLEVKESKEVKEEVQTPFDLLWFKWTDYRTAIKKPIKPVSMELAKKELQDLSGGNFELAEKIVNQSIAKSWQGLFELKNSKNVTEEPVGKKLRTL